MQTRTHANRTARSALIQVAAAALEIFGRRTGYESLAGHGNDRGRAL